MTIEQTGTWWVGSDAFDIKEYLTAYSAENHLIDDYRGGNCKCGSDAFELDCNNEEGAALRTCKACGQTHPICDSDDALEDAELERWKCVECGGEACNLGVGFSLYQDKGSIRWLYIGVRCQKCGVLGCPVEWKVGYAPSLQLLDEV